MSMERLEAEFLAHGASYNSRIRRKRDVAISFIFFQSVLTRVSWHRPYGFDTSELRDVCFT